MKATTDGFVSRLTRGAMGGLAGTMALQGLRMTSERLLPKTMPPIKESPDEYFVKEAERHLPSSVPVSPMVEKIAGQTLAVGYGVVLGSLCSIFGWRRIPDAVRGAGLGLCTWAAGYLGWLPVVGLMPPVRKQTPAQVAGPIVRHVVYGIVTVEVSELMRRALGSRARTPTRTRRRAKR